MQTLVSRLDTRTKNEMDPSKFSHVYRNIRRNMYSIKQNNRVIGHSPELIIAAAMFRVQPSGQAKVRATKRKNVHAYINGIILQKPADYQVGRQIHYNPYKDDFFMMDGQPVTFMTLVLLNSEGKIFELTKKEEKE